MCETIINCLCGRVIISKLPGEWRTTCYKCNTVYYRFFNVDKDDYDIEVIKKSLDK